MNTRRLTLTLLFSAFAAPAAAQDADPPPLTLPAATLAEWQARPLSWRSYGGRTYRATATVYGNDADDRDERPYSVVLVPDPANRAPITDDARFLADLVGRELGADPVRLAFLFRLPLEGDAGTLTVRATVRRSRSGRLVSPSWRVLSPDEVEDYTDRQLR